MYKLIGKNIVLECDNKGSKHIKLRETKVPENE